MNAPAKLTPARQRRFDNLFLPAAQEAARRMTLDASGVVILARELEELDAETYAVEYPEFVGAKLLPMKTNINPGASTYKYKVRDRVGEFAPASNWSDDSPNQDIAGDDVESSLYSWRGHYAVSIQDQRASAMAGFGIESERATAARENAEAKLDSILATGYSALGITGFYNNSNVTAVTPIVGSWELAGTDGEEIVNDLNKMVAAFASGSLGAVEPNALVLTPTQREYAIAKRVPNSDLTALAFFKMNHPGINILTWARGETAGAASVRRMMMGRMDRRTVEGLLPVRWETFAPEMRGLVMRVECHMRTGGVIFRYPAAWRYMDGC